MSQNKFESMGGPPPEEEQKDEAGAEQPEEEPEEEKQPEGSPIQETPEAISYMGVKLDKAENPDPDIVEPRDRYEDYINYQYALELQQKIAVSFKEGEPILLEGGTSLGKTTTIRKMAAELGYEVHYVNLNGQTDVENLMGRYITNPNKTSEEDPEYVFAEGEITQGLRQEQGKKKIIVLDEINAAHPSILKRLNEVMDSLDKNGEVTLTEDASERVSTNKENTKVAGLMNPPGEGYEGVNPLSKELLRRWNYQKEPSELPPEAFTYMRKARRGKLPRTEEPPQEMFLYSNEGDLNLEKLDDIPGYDQIEDQFEEFHRSAKKLLENRDITEDQPQEILFDDHEELRRFQQFVLRYYNGDITETAQRALRFYYSGKLQDQKDKQKLEELINHISYTPPSDSRRRDVEEEEEVGTQGKEKERSLEEFEKKSLEYMEKLLEQGADKDFVARGLAGLDSDKAWKMREELLEQGARPGSVALGLAGLDSDKAWQMREEFLEQGADKNSVALGLAGLDSDKAWKMREEFLEQGVDKDLVARGLAGLDSDKAWKMREELLEKGPTSVAQGLAGDFITFVWRYQLEGSAKEDTGAAPEEEGTVEKEKKKFEEMAVKELTELLETEGVDKDDIAQGLAGCDSKEAHELREKLWKTEGADKSFIARGLAGCDSKQAHELREKLNNDQKPISFNGELLDSVAWRRARGWL